MLLDFWYFFKRKTPQTFRPVILVTGCGSGIGNAISKLLYYNLRYRVIITARAESLAKLHAQFPASDRFWVRELDVTNESQRGKLLKEIQEKWQGVNILINNAGISYRSVVEHMTEADEKKQMAVNYFGPIGLIREVLPQMRRLGRGKIINISSVSGMLAMPTMGSYTASKYALEGMSEALWYELRPLGVSVSLIQPGFIHSNSFKNVYYTQQSKAASSAPDADYSDYYRSMAPFAEKLMGLSRTTPEKVALIVLDVIQTENPPLWIPATLDAVVFYYLRRLLPRRLLLPFLFRCLPQSKHWAKNYTKKRH